MPEKLIRIWKVSGFIVHVYEFDHGHQFKFDFKFKKPSEVAWTWAPTTFVSLEFAKDDLLWRIDCKSVK